VLGTWTRAGSGGACQVPGEHPLGQQCLRTALRVWHSHTHPFQAAALTAPGRRATPTSYAPAVQLHGPGRTAPLCRPNSGGFDNAPNYSGSGPGQGHSCAAPGWPGDAPVPPEAPHLCPRRDCPSGLSQPHPSQRVPTCRQHGVHGEFPYPPSTPSR
jgi:hypothetical protein